MLASIFSNPTITQLLELFFWLLGAFLIGLYFGKKIGEKSKNKKRDLYQEFDANEQLDLTHDTSKIRATKTFERGGQETVRPIIEPEKIIIEPVEPIIKQVKTVIEPEKKELNFDTIGKATFDKKDDLTKIKGIGPGIELKLNGIGIYTFKQISNFNSNDISKITDLIKFFPNSIEKDDWVGQAFEIINKK